MTVESDAYSKHMNLKLAADELGIKWQTLYSRLKSQGVKITGDKLRYGSDRDKLSAKAESLFMQAVPSALCMNAIRWQSKYDFEVNGFKVDVKCARKRCSQKRFPDKKSWSFSFKKQTLICDFVCCFCLNDENETAKIILVPSEFFKGLQTVTVSCQGYSKWLDYAIDLNEIEPFFSSLK